ncbi:MAG: mannose-6-phosphate isomerase, class I, partial [Pseudomonadota bacterium]
MTALDPQASKAGRTPAAAISIRGRVRHYAWGGDAFLPQLLGRPADGQPWAEYWLGAHPTDPSSLVYDGQETTLDRLIAADPAFWLGEQTAARFGELPYLMKVLDVAKPLSIQVHPNLAQAKAGFAREETAGIDRRAPERNFKDSNHKPELALALSRFWLLYGFRENAG